MTLKRNKTKNNSDEKNYYIYVCVCNLWLDAHYIVPRKHGDGKPKLQNARCCH